MQKVALLLALATALTSALAGCSPASSAALDGRDFLSVAVTEAGVNKPLVPGTQIRLSFTPGNLGAQAGCNTIGGTYRLDGGQLVFEGGGMTEMGCDPERHAQDDWLVAFLSSRPTVQLAGDNLTLTSGATVIRLLDRRVADPDRPLVGPTWVLVALISGAGADGAVSSIPEGVVASLRFLEDSTLEVQTGCNQGGGRWALEGSTIRFEPIALTKRACVDDTAKVETAVMTVLGAGNVQPTIRASTLVLQAGGSGLQFEAR
ncbi:MAG: META domain-containing protein [Chloroflexi bacterium]|nr:META domain-containing protein [Chloroflexota bacterium]